ncbi:uncharacterized protein [Palaemon carinicauda]|uniref:uncharacterized protein n=1 Tax=Palaemon carinicauda TaxID=392227 RepID=UPI0035B58F78
MSIIVCYAPTKDSPTERRDEYYEELQRVLDEIPGREKILITDSNAKVGRNNQGIENVMGVEGLSKVANENEAYFIDHITVNKKKRYRGADIGIGHTLLITTLIIKLKAPNRKMDRIPRFDTIKLLEEYRETFAIECRNQFAVLRGFKRQTIDN